MVKGISALDHQNAKEMKARYLLFLLLVMASALNIRANDADWNFNPYAFQYDMTVYVALSTVDNKSINDTSEYQIAAFCGDECRGIAEEKAVGEHKYFYLRIRSNITEGETINFRVRNATTQKIAKVVETIEFKSQQTIGYPSTPFAINALNPYSVTFVIDGVEHRSNLFFGDVITAPTETNKEGYTFVGWSPEADETVPDHDVTYTAIFSINKYTITFDTDGGTEIAPITQDYNSTVIAPAGPTKIGYTFAGWDKEIPSSIPAENIAIKALWTINQYTINFDTDGGTEIAPITKDYNTAVTAPADPTKTGYTFVGWDKEIPTTMPAENMTIKALWTINKYMLTYKVDGDVYKQFEIEYNSAITPEPAPEKEGYTFSGWSEIPSTMPANDVEVTGTFNVNKYKVTFISDGVTIKEETLDFGTAITAPEDPKKVGHTFTGWNPAVDPTVPSHDVTYEALFEINIYRLTYYVDGELYKEYELEYGAEITPEENPVKEGYDFSGWSKIPVSMPDHNVNVFGTFTISTGINNIGANPSQDRIYDLSGNVIRHKKKGIYIINGKKILIK